MSIVFINCSILPLTNSQYYLIHNLTIFRPNLHWLIYALTRLLCCGDSRLSFCHINTCISMPDISWKQFLSCIFVTRTELPTLFLWQKLLPGDVFCRLGNAPKSFSAGALPRTPLGELTALPQILQLVGRGLAAPSPRTSPQLGPSGLGLRPYGPRCLVPQRPRKINPSYGLA